MFESGLRLIQSKLLISPKYLYDHKLTILKSGIDKNWLKLINICQSILVLHKLLTHCNLNLYLLIQTVFLINFLKR